MYHHQCSHMHAWDLHVAHISLLTACPRTWVSVTNTMLCNVYKILFQHDDQFIFWTSSKTVLKENVWSSLKIWYTDVKSEFSVLGLFASNLKATVPSLYGIQAMAFLWNPQVSYDYSILNMATMTVSNFDLGSRVQTLHHSWPKNDLMLYCYLTFWEKKCR